MQKENGFSVRVWCLIVLAQLVFSGGTGAAEIRLNQYLQEVTGSLGHSFLLSQSELGQLVVNNPPAATANLDVVDQLLSAHGLERVPLGNNTSSIQPQDLAQVSISTLQISADSPLGPWGQGLDDRLSSTHNLSVDNASVQGQVLINDLLDQTANVYGSGSDLFIRGVPRSFGIDSTQNTTVVMAGQPLPSYLLETAALPRSGLNTATVRRGTQFGFGAGLVPSYGGGIEIRTGCEGLTDVRRLTAGWADNSLRSANFSAGVEGMDGTVIACVDLLAESETAPLFSLSQTAADRDSRTFQSQVMWTPLSLPDVTIALTAVDLAADLTEQLSLYLDDGPFDLSQLQLSGPSFSRNSGTLVSANILGEHTNISWNLNVGALNSQYFEDSKPDDIFAAVANKRYQASLQSMLDLGGAGTLALGLGNIHARSSSTVTQRLGSARPNALYRLVGEANLESSVFRQTITQHRFGTLRYQWQLGPWDFGITNRLDVFRFDRDRVDTFGYVISDDCRFELLLPLINPTIPTCEELFDAGRTPTPPDSWRTRSKKWTRQISVARSLSPSLRLGIVAFEGFRPGGALSGDESGADDYDEEVARTVEASIRYRWGSKSRLSLNLFSTRFIDQQIFLNSEQLLDTDRRIVNVGRSKSRGAELEGHWDITDAQSLSWSLGYLSTEYVDYVPIEFTNSEIDISGNRFVGAPSWTGSAQWRYRYSHWLSFGVMLIAADDAFSSPNNLEVSQAPAYARLDTSATVTYGRFSATVFVENLSNERYLQTTVNRFAARRRFTPALQPARGRTVGALVSVNF